MGVFIWDDVHSPSVERQGCSGVGTRGNCVPTHFALDCINTWLRSHRCASDRQFRSASQSLQINRTILCGNARTRMLILFELFDAVFVFIWCGNGVPIRWCIGRAQSQLPRRQWWHGQWAGCDREHCGTREERSTLLLNGPGLRCLFVCLLLDHPSQTQQAASRVRLVMLTFGKWLEVSAMLERPAQSISEVFGFGSEEQHFVVVVDFHFTCSLLDVEVEDSRHSFCSVEL